MSIARVIVRARRSGALWWTVTLGCLFLAATAPAASPHYDWPAYNGDVSGDHYSPLTQITPQNVNTLKAVWRFGSSGQGVAPPRGTLSAIDLNTGKYLWKVPLGEYPELVAQGLKDTGSENYGGPILTASGLLFIGATIFDHKLRAFDSKTGHLLWQTELPYAGIATPATYQIDGRQYVVIATDNARNPKGPQGFAYVAFALP